MNQSHNFPYSISGKKPLQPIPNEYMESISKYSRMSSRSIMDLGGKQVLADTTE